MSESISKDFKAGFVNIIGRPNVGKSTLVNALMGEKLSIVTAKAQTTRHRIMGIWNEPNFQVAYSDTPGILKPAYQLHKAMMDFVTGSLEDADLLVFVADIFEREIDETILKRINRVEVPLILVINKTDLVKANEVEETRLHWYSKLRPKACFEISALNKTGLTELKEAIVEYIPVHPPYFDTEEYTNRTERFFASEILREKIFLLYKEEVPYCSEVIIQGFKEKEDIIVISCLIIVERDTQKGIIIGKNGDSIKKLGIMARKDLELFFNKKVFLEQSVKVEPDWRSKSNVLNRLGYQG
ncbi:MAG: GTPase Era [Opitutaceae bacterium]|nr:GTPase Era [Cytophagales bacterium]